MSRAERRYLTYKVALRRSLLYPSERNLPGKFRKWNLTCKCRCCRHGGRQYDMKTQRIKDLRRNILPLEEDCE